MGKAALQQGETHMRGAKRISLLAVVGLVLGFTQTLANAQETTAMLAEIVFAPGKKRQAG